MADVYWALRGCWDRAAHMNLSLQGPKQEREASRCIAYSTYRERLWVCCDSVGRLFIMACHGCRLSLVASSTQSNGWEPLGYWVTEKLPHSGYFWGSFLPARVKCRLHSYVLGSCSLVSSMVTQKTKQVFSTATCGMQFRHENLVSLTYLENSILETYSSLS